MTDLLDLYENTLKGTQLSVKQFDLQAFSAVVDIEEIDGHRAVLALLSSARGDAWLECTDAVFYRLSGDTEWVNAGNPDLTCQTSDLPHILNAEIGGQDKSLAIHHITGDRWSVATVSETTGSGVAFDTTRIGVVSPGDAKNTRLSLIHRNYWDASQSQVAQTRFIGFIKTVAEDPDDA